MKLKQDKKSRFLLPQFLRKFAKQISCLFILIASLFFILTYKPQAQSLPSCSSLPSNMTPNAGVNCLYFGLPLCSTVSNPQHRINCADLIDLPLCSEIVTGPGISANPGRNCVDLCSNSTYDNPSPAANPPLVRGQDYAIFNQNCIRFCDNVEAGIVAIPGVNCTSRKCHQLESSVNPNPGTNCQIMPCNLLTPDELNKAKFDDDSKKYCEGTNLKCYNFTQAQLPYLRRRLNNTMCVIHNCAPAVPSCGANDTLNISNQGYSYQTVYENYINLGLPITSDLFCNKIDCKPVVRVQYRCLSNRPDRNGNIAGDESDVLRNSECDNSVDGSNQPVGGAICTNNYCYKTIDCNLPQNNTSQFCLAATSSNNVNNSDPFESWFYRPAPLAKATLPNGVLRNMEPELCYTQSQMEHDNGWGRHARLGLIDFGWFHESGFYEARSPGSCRGISSGFRGTGYSYLGGTDFSLYTLPSPEAIYIAGYAVTDFSTSIPVYKVTVCTRHANTLALNTAGKRECTVSAAFSSITSKYCGDDVCRDLYIKDDEPLKCLMTENLSNNNDGGDCSSRIDGNLRVRAVKYGDKICAYLDSKGQVAYNNMFFNGHETLNDGKTCVNDPSASGGNCRGYNSNSYKTVADIWRTVLKAHYIDNNRPATDSVRGYLDRSGRLYKEQECPKVTLRIPPPNLYNLATVSNSDRLFSPALVIRAVTKIRGGPDAAINADGNFAETDFHYPEIKVQFGSSIFKMSLGLNYTGFESAGEGYTASPSHINATTTYNGRPFNAELFVRKEYYENNSSPIFCLYRRYQDANGVLMDPIRVGCVNRKFPDIDNKTERNYDATLPVRKIFVYPFSGNLFDVSKIGLRYITSFGANNVDNNCSGDDQCSAEILMENSNPDFPTCYQQSEGYKLCAQREICSKLNNECIKNEIDSHNARLTNQPQSSFESIRHQCNEILLPFCNRKKGLPENSNATVFNQNPSNLPVDQRMYGWFNELCVVSGFQGKLKNVVSYLIANNQTGKCKIDPSSPYLTDGNSATNCNDGGKAPNCLCILAPENYVPDSDEVVRLQTPREAGLCIDMPIPQLCPQIEYNLNPNSDVNDRDYVASSLNKSSYDNIAGVHISHKYRTEGKPAPDPVPLYGHAEFAASLIGFLDVEGMCKGFWTKQKNSEGVPLTPTLSCLNVSGSPQWQSAVRNPCVRYSCEAITTDGPDTSGQYQGNYGVNETLENKGLSNGFATWPKFTKTNDFLETVNATACIPGFAKVGSTRQYDSNGKIIAYNGGSAPSRTCNQTGGWGSAITNSCQRISCSAISPRAPTSASDSAAWQEWYSAGGAAFASVNASRSRERIQNESISHGTCNNNLGFFQSPGGSAPTRECDYLGNWGPVINPCVTTCAAINDDSQAASLNNGFSKWNAVIAAVNSSGANSGTEGVFAGCVAGYITNPYPSTKDINGNDLPASQANDLTRIPENPKRMCAMGTNSYGYNVSVWGSVVNGCINRCPGADTDSRVGVGVTVHPGSRGNININWTPGELNQYAYATNWQGIETLFDASYFAQGRTNGYYLVRRFCNSNGKWSDPEVMCAANNGQLDHAAYQLTNQQIGYKNSLVAGSSTTVTGVCSSGYWNVNDGQGAAPVRQCIFADANKYIDKVYMPLAVNSQDCVARTCPPYSYVGPPNDPVVTFNSTARLPIGSQLQGTCINHGVGGSIFTALDPGKVPPTVFCQADGTWSAVQNAGNCKKSCDVPGWPWHVVWVDVSNCGGDASGAYIVLPHTLKHGTTLEFAGTDECRGWSKYLLYGEKCDNGQVSYNHKWYGDAAVASYTTGKYNYSTNNFDGPIITIIPVAKTPSFNAMPYYYIDKYGATKPIFDCNANGPACHRI